MRRWTFIAAAFSAVSLFASVAPAIAAGQPRSAPPDFSGLWQRVNPITFEPIADETLGKPIARLAVEGPDAAEIMAGNFDNPILQPWARQTVQDNAEREIALDHVNTSDDSCWPLGVPQILNLREPVQILQSADYVVILYQRDHQVRRIALNRPHSENPRRSWYGESVGHYEGDTLVVDTTAQIAHKMSVVDNYGTPHTEFIHVIERYRLIRDEQGVGLEVRFRVDDPGAFTRPWGGRVVYRQSRLPFAEVVCAENNRSFDPGSMFGDMPSSNAPAF